MQIGEIMAFEPIDDDGFEQDLSVPDDTEPTVPSGHLLRKINGTDILVKIPTPHQVIAYNRALGVLQDKAFKIQERKNLDDEDRYRALMPLLVDMDSKALTFAESMMPDADQRAMVDEWLIAGVVTPTELVRALQGIEVPTGDDEDTPTPEPVKRPNPLKKATAVKKAANARRTKK